MVQKKKKNPAGICLHGDSACSVNYVHSNDVCNATNGLSQGEDQSETARVLPDSWNFSNIFPGYGSLALSHWRLVMMMILGRGQTNA